MPVRVVQYFLKEAKIFAKSTSIGVISLLDSLRKWSMKENGGDRMKKMKIVYFQTHMN